MGRREEISGTKKVCLLLGIRMALWKLLRPILNVTGATKKLQKAFEKIVADNQASGLSANSAYNAAKREVMETLKKIKVTKKAEGGEIVFGKNVDKDLL